MKKTVLLVCVFQMLALVGVVGCGGENAENKPVNPVDAVLTSPEDTVKSYLKAINAENVDKATSCWKEGTHRDLEKEKLELNFDMVSIWIYNIDTKLVSQNDNKAMVQVNYDSVTIGRDGSGYELHNQEVVVLVLTDGKWLIIETADKEEYLYRTDNELGILQDAVVELMANAGVNELDNEYDEVDTAEELKNVTAGGGAYNLYSHFEEIGYCCFGEGFDIAKDGTVTLD